MAALFVCRKGGKTMNTITEVTIFVCSFFELKEVLKEVRELKRENPNTKFRIEVLSMI